MYVPHSQADLYTISKSSLYPTCAQLANPLPNLAPRYPATRDFLHSSAPPLLHPLPLPPLTQRPHYHRSFSRVVNRLAGRHKSCGPSKPYLLRGFAYRVGRLLSPLVDSVDKFIVPIYVSIPQPPLQLLLNPSNRSS